jgi:hypothetical protein
MSFTAILLLMLAAGTLFAAQQRASETAFDIGDYGGADIAKAECTFKVGGTNAQLVLLLKALCYRQQVLGEPEWTEKLAGYGRELFDRARAGTVDLQTVDDGEAMLKVLKVLREAGAR